LISAVAWLALTPADAAARDTAPGAAFAWGYNADGELGDGTTTDRLSPVAVSGPADAGVISVAIGDRHSLAVKADGSVLAWGLNDSGQLGDGTTTDRVAPAVVTGLGPGSGVVAVAAGYDHSLAVKSDGTVLAWGSNAQGQLGNVAADGLTPAVVSSLGSGSGVVAVSAGGALSLALKSDGSVLAWGYNHDGQVGDGTKITRVTPVAVVDLGPGSGVVEVAAGGLHSIALRSDGTVLTWGSNASGQLGSGSTGPRRRQPGRVVGLVSGSGITSVAAGVYHSMALRPDGSVLAWGANSVGELGDGTTTNRNVPVLVSGLGPGSGVIAVDGGGAYSLALKSDGSVLSWGYNHAGQLGDGSTANRTAPGPVLNLGPDSGVTAISAGGNHSVVVSTATGSPVTLSCTHVDAGSESYLQCRVADTHGVRRVKVGDLATHVTESSISFSCARSVTTVGFRVRDDQHRHRVAVSDCGTFAVHSFIVASDGTVTS
jgi:alpha-tubulin suppressor-like RCC1 family protein